MKIQHQNLTSAPSISVESTRTGVQDWQDLKQILQTCIKALLLWQDLPLELHGAQLLNYHTSEILHQELFNSTRVMSTARSVKVTSTDVLQAS